MERQLHHRRWYRQFPKLLLLFSLWAFLSGYAQSTESLYSFSWKGRSLQQVFEEIERRAGIRFSYNPLELDASRKIDLEVSNASLDNLLDMLGSKMKFRYQRRGEIVMLQFNDIDVGNAAVQSALSGRVLNASRHPIPGVTVTNGRTNVSTVTDDRGQFTIVAETGDAIRFRMMGFGAYTVTVENTRQPLEVVLGEEMVELEETVVTALGIKREERALGYAMSEVDGSEIQRVREPNVINSLAGRVAGLVINTTSGGPSGSSRVVIRGNTTITGNNQPLYVVDGVPIDNSNYGQVEGSRFAAGYDMGDAISALNPDDIDKISVLKGPSAAALYGSRAANGVILITTKRGSANKELGIELNSTTTLEQQLTTFDGYQTLYGQGRNQNLVLDANQARNTLFSNFGPRLDPDLMITYFDGQQRPYSLAQDNISGFFRTGATYTNNIALTNATERSSFRLAVSDLRNSDIVPASGIRRNSFTFNGTSKFGENLSVEARVFYLNEDVTNRPALADDPSNIGNNFVGLANNVDQTMFSQYYKDAQGTYVDWGGGQYRLNPYWIINEMRNDTKKDRLMGAFQTNYTITEWMNVQGRVATDLTFLDFERYTPRTTPGSLAGRLNASNQRYSTTEADILLSMQKQVSTAWHLSARLGASLSRIRNAGRTMEFLNMTMTDVISPNSFADKAVIENDYRKFNNSAYVLLSAGYKGYLYADATVRQDASSTLPQGNNSYIYPSLAGSFVFSDAFNIDKKILTMGRLRVSAAEVGNDTDPYQLDLYYALNPLSVMGQSVGSISSTLLPNPLLRPTRTRSFETGVELKFLENRIGLDVTYYTQRSRDQINRVPIPISSGFTSQVINAGVILNKGVEMVLTTQPVSNEQFHWDLNINLARNINDVESLAEGVPFLTLSDARWMGVSVVAMPNAPYGSILGYGYQYDPQGNIILDPNTLTPVISAERQLLGQGTFRWTGGLFSSMSYKNFGLTTVLDMKQGADLFSMSNLFAAVRGSLTSTLAGREEWIQSEEERLAAGMTEDQWRDMGRVRGYVPQGVVQTGTDGNGNPVYEQNTRAVDPSLYWSGIYTDGNGIAIPYIYDASYLKVREIILSYQVPTAYISKWGIKGLNVSIVSRNPFIISKAVPNIDPDSNYNNGNGQGLEYGSLPSRRSWGFNVNVRF